MPDDSGKLSQFWQELKRRKVTRVITVYAAAAFVILQLIEILAPSLRLPEWTMNFILVVLIVGFVIAVILSWIYDVHPNDGIVKTKPARKVSDIKPTPSTGRWKIATFVSVVVIIGLLAFNIFGRRETVEIDESLAKSIAVLPFHNYSGDPDQDPMCLGLTVEIISNLYKISSFDEVRSLTTVLNYQDPVRNISLIADELKVNYILEGSFKRIDDEIRVTAQLIEPKSDKHIWLKDYDLPYNEVIGIPAEVAFQIADHLKAFITGDEKQKIEKMPTKNLEAYELMQSAIYLFNANFWDKIDQIIQLAQEASGIDPDYADAYAMIGLLTLAKGAYFGGVEMNAVSWEATTYLNKALELDDSNVRAISGLGAINHFLQWNYIKAEEEYLKAINYELGERILNSWYILFLIQMNRPEDAIIFMETYMETLGWEYEFYGPKTFILAREDQKARDIINKRRDSETVFSATEVAEMFLWLGDYNSAIDLSESTIQLYDPDLLPPRFQSNLAVAYYMTGDSGQAATIIDSLILKSSTSSVGYPEYFVGSYYSWIGEIDSAFCWLEKAYNNRSPEMPWLKVDPAFNSLKDEARYWDLYDRTGHKAYDEYMANKRDH